MIDLHCHIDLFPEPHEIVRACVSRSVFVLSVTTTPMAWEETSRLTENYELMPTALGLHPQLAGERQSELELFDSLIRNTGWLGEIGLDGAPEFQDSWDAQVCVFQHILLSAALAGGRVMTIHSRRAAKEVIDLLKQVPDSGTAVLHWFSGSFRDLSAAIDAGFWFSVGQPMLRSKNGRALVDRMPRARVLTETDGPFAQSDGQPVYPWEVSRTENDLSTLWCQDPDETRDLLQKNLIDLTNNIFS